MGLLNFGLKVGKVLLDSAESLLSTPYTSPCGKESMRLLAANESEQSMGFKMMQSSDGTWKCYNLQTDTSYLQVVMPSETTDNVISYIIPPFEKTDIGALQKKYSFYDSDIQFNWLNRPSLMDVFSGNLTALKGGPEDKAIDFLFEVKNIKIGDLVNIGEATIKCTKTQLIVVCSTVVALGILGIGYKVFSSSGGSISNNKKQPPQNPNNQYAVHHNPNIDSSPAQVKSGGDESTLIFDIPFETIVTNEKEDLLNLQINVESTTQEGVNLNSISRTFMCKEACNKSTLITQFEKDIFRKLGYLSVDKK
jgi:hypothetical protein